MLKSQTSRAFAVLFIFFVGCALTLWYAGIGRSKYLHPTVWYFYILGPNAGIDIQSPTGRAIIKMEPIPQFSFPAYEQMNREYKERCVGTGSIYRDVFLCAPAGTTHTDEFRLAASYFKTKVDELYSDMNAQKARDVAFYLGASFAAWSALLILWLTLKWIRSGTRADA